MELVGGRYEVTRSLAGGGMGSVCEAVDRVMGRRVALKTLHPHLAAEESLCERFRREALAAAALAHPHIAQATDYGVDPKHGPFLVMELLVGEALSERLARDGAFTPERAVFVAAQALDALAAAHDAGIVHRDIKPSNLFLTQLSGVADVVKVIDFGIAKLYESKTWQRLTATGQVIGTPTYMAPEQALGRPIDPRVDVYAMGLVLYAMLTGRPAFRPGGPETIVPILEGRYVPIRALAPHVDPALAEVVARAMHVDRDARFSDARAMRDALAPWLPSTVSSLHASRPPSAVSSVPPAAPASDDATRGPARRASPSAPPQGSSPASHRASPLPASADAPRSSSPLAGPLPAAPASDSAPQARRSRVIGLVVGGAILGASLFVGAFVAWRGGASREAPPVLARAGMPVALAQPSSVNGGESKPPRERVVPRETREVSNVDERSNDDVRSDDDVRSNDELGSPVEGAGVATPERDGRSARARPSEAATVTSAGVCEDTCRWARDGECDDGRPGATSACSPGTDCSDCGPWQGPLPRIPAVELANGMALGNVQVSPRLGARRNSCTTTTYGAFDASPFGGVVVRQRISDRFPGGCLASVGAPEALLLVTTDPSGAVADVRVSPDNAVMRTCLQGRLSGLRFGSAGATTLRVPIFCN